MMATFITLQKIKEALRIKHSALDSDILDTIDACLTDLKVCGIQEPKEDDKLVLNVLKLYCRAEFTDDAAKAEKYMERYDKFKACLMMAEGYGGAPREN